MASQHTSLCLLGILILNLMALQIQGEERHSVSKALLLGKVHRTTCVGKSSNNPKSSATLGTLHLREKIWGGTGGNKIPALRNTAYLTAESSVSQSRGSVFKVPQPPVPPSKRLVSLCQHLLNGALWQSRHHDTDSTWQRLPITPGSHDQCKPANFCHRGIIKGFLKH